MLDFNKFYGTGIMAIKKLIRRKSGLPSGSNIAKYVGDSIVVAAEV